jgi:hypothetical protein
MSTTYVLTKQISFEELLDGRLEEHCVYEDTERFGSPGKINKGKDAYNDKVLTDGMNYIGVYGDEYVKTIQRCGNNNAGIVLDVISDVFETDYLSEYQPEFWGFESRAEQDLAEMMGAERESTIIYEKIMKFVRGESHDFEPNSRELHDAIIAKELIAGNQDLADPNRRDELFEIIRFHHKKPTPIVPDGSDGDLIRTILMRDEGEPFAETKETLDQVLEGLENEGLIEKVVAADFESTEQSVERCHEIKVREIIKHTGCEPMIAEVAIQFALDDHALTDQFTLNFKYHGLVAVSEVLSNPVKFDQQSLVDPLELSNVNYAATFEWNDGNPLVSSYSHGGRIYRFHENQINKSILLHGISIAHTEEGQHFAPRALRAACDLLFGEYTAQHE